MEYRVYAALLLDLEYNGRRTFKTPNNFKHASPNRLKTGLQTNEDAFAVVLDASSIA